MASKRVVR